MAARSETRDSLYRCARDDERGGLRFVDRDHLGLHYASLDAFDAPIVFPSIEATRHLDPDRAAELVRRALCRPEFRENVRGLKTNDGFLPPCVDKCVTFLLQTMTGGLRFASLSLLAIPITCQRDMDLLVSARHDGCIPNLRTLEVTVLSGAHADERSEEGEFDVCDRQVDLASLVHFAGIRELFLDASLGDDILTTGGIGWLRALHDNGLRALTLHDKVLLLLASKKKDPQHEDSVTNVLLWDLAHLSGLEYLELDWCHCSSAPEPCRNYIAAVRHIGACLHERRRRLKGFKVGDLPTTTDGDHDRPPPRSFFENVWKRVTAVSMTLSVPVRALPSNEEIERAFPDGEEIDGSFHVTDGDLKISTPTYYYTMYAKTHPSGRMLLRELYLNDIHVIRDLFHSRHPPCIGCLECSSLRCLRIRRCYETSDMSSLASMAQLQELAINFANPVVQRRTLDMTFLGSLTRLTDLSIKAKRSDVFRLGAEIEETAADPPTWFPGLSESLSRLRSLVALKLYHLPVSLLAPALPYLGRLEFLSLKTSGKVPREDLSQLAPALQSATGIRALHVIGQGGLDYPYNFAFKDPDCINADYCDPLPLDFLRSMPNLRVLRLKGVRFATLRPLAECPSATRLRLLSLMGSTSDEQEENGGAAGRSAISGGITSNHLRHLVPLRHLECLDLDQFNATDLSPLTDLTRLYCLDANNLRSRWCYGVRELSRLTSLTSLHLDYVMCDPSDLKVLEEVLRPSLRDYVFRTRFRPDS